MANLKICTKVCSKCKKELPFSKFHKNKAEKDGLSFWCKVCKQRHHEKWYNTPEGQQYQKRKQEKALQEKVKKRGKMFGTRCVLCKRFLFKKKRDYARHHIDYINDKVILVCYLCHQILHFQKVWKHPIFALYGKDKMMIEFAKRLLKVVEKSEKPLDKS